MNEPAWWSNLKGHFGLVTAAIGFPDLPYWTVPVGYVVGLLILPTVLALVAIVGLSGYAEYKARGE